MSYAWVQCPKCGYSRPSVEREIADKGGTEALKITCHECGEERRVIP